MAKTHKVSEDGIKPKNAQTRPEYAGEHNMKNVTRPKSAGDEYKLGQLETVLEIRKKRQECMKQYREQRPSSWTEEELRKHIDLFFEWCINKEIVPSKPLMMIWFNCSSATLYDWSKRQGFFGEVIGEAFRIMETLYFNDLDNRFLPNAFRLKSTYGYVETQKVEVETNKSDLTTTEDIEKAVDNLII